MSLDLLKKADLVLADMTSGGGLLTPEQGNRFVEELIDQPTILRSARTITMDRPQMEINAIGFGSRVLRPAVENTALSAGDRSKPTTRQVTLNTKEFIAEVRLPYAILEDNIERGTLEQTLLGMLAKRVSLDIEELVLRGDTSSGDAYLATLNGFVKRITTNAVDAATTYISPLTFNNALLALPDKYKRNLDSLAFYVPSAVEQNYRLQVANRQTNLGDAMLTGRQPVGIMGVKMLPASLMPANTGLLVDPFNLLIGIQRQVTIESDRDITARQMIYVVTIRLDVNIETEPACVKITNLVAEA